MGLLLLARLLVESLKVQKVVGAAKYYMMEWIDEGILASIYLHSAACTQNLSANIQEDLAGFVVKNASEHAHKNG